MDTSALLVPISWHVAQVLGHPKRAAILFCWCRYDAQAHVHHGMMHAGQYYPQVNLMSNNRVNLMSNKILISRRAVLSAGAFLVLDPHRITESFEGCAYG